MSRPRSRSPNYRRLPSGQRDFSPDRVLSDRKHHDPFPDDPLFGPQHHLDQGRLPPCRPLPPPVPMYYEKRRLSPPRDGGYEVDRHRGETREHVQRNENRRRSPTWSQREEFSFRGHHQRKPGMNWRGEDQGRGRGGFRDSSPGMRPDEGRGGYRGRWTGQGPNGGRFRDGLRHERGAPLKGPRREMDEHPGPLCYSSDRQLSLDLVNVGRQRLDFLPALHSGAHQESSVRMSAFAQEIITLVHLVKEQYFSGDGLTLSERFSAPQSAELSEDAEELTLNQRFSSNRGFSMNLDSVLDDEEPTQGLSKPPLRGPGDLRHDLERRRQEKLEGVKVTILGNSISQHAMGADSELNEAPQSEWAGQQRRRLEGNMVSSS
uniref:BCLAF1 and THRAP3 family member 3 n=1 Tax=Oryzias sinensis TaxID=183150 RepID=A0A8C7ZVA9_9TELE